MVLRDKFVLDFNQGDIARDLSAGATSAKAKTPSARRLGRVSSVGGADGVAVSNYPGRIHTQPTTVLREGVFIDDVVTSLPYRLTEIVGLDHGSVDTEGELSGDVWLVRERKFRCMCWRVNATLASVVQTTGDSRNLSTLLCCELILGSDST